MKTTLLLSLPLLAGALAAQPVTYLVELTGAQEVPPNNSSGIGSATVTLDPGNGSVSVSGTYSNLTTSTVAVHIHGTSRRGVNSGVVVGLTASGGTSGSLSGSGTLTAAQVQSMLDGLTYLNVHTSMFPGGEIRGQIDAVPGSGSTGAPGVSISGNATPGGTLQLAAPPSINNKFLLVGLALPALQTLPLPPSLACMAPTNIGIDITFTPLVFGSSATLPIPAGLPPFWLGVQCALVPLTPTCLDLSVASRVAIRP
jgi:hypothetical protein